MAYKVRSKTARRRLPKGVAPVILHVVAVAVALVVAVLLPRAQGKWDWPLLVFAGMLGGGVGLAGVTWCVRAALGKRARSPAVSATATFLFRASFLLVTCGLMGVFFRVALK